MLFFVIWNERSVVSFPSHSQRATFYFNEKSLVNLVLLNRYHADVIAFIPLTTKLNNPLYLCKYGMILTHINSFSRPEFSTTLTNDYISRNSGLRKIPAENMPNIPNDRSFADRDLQVFITWGRKEMVVRTPAINPKASLEFI